MEHKTVRGIGGQVHYWISRPQGESRGTVVFSHGLTADHTMFDRQVIWFQKDYTVLTWDIPMHGLSVPYEDFTYENTAKDLYRIFQQEGIEQAALAGMSMGGYPSQMFAHCYPERVQCFIGIDTTPFGTGYYSPSDLWWLSKVKPMAKCFPEQLLRKSMALSVSATAYARDKMLKMLSPLSKDRIITQMDIAYGQFARENRDLQLTCPVLILLGDKDRTGKVRQYCTAWAKATGYPLHIIPNAAHFSNADNPEQVNREIEQFIRQWEAAEASGGTV